MFLSRDAEILPISNESRQSTETPERGFNQQNQKTCVYFVFEPSDQPARAFSKSSSSSKGLRAGREICKRNEEGARNYTAVLMPTRENNVKAEMGFFN